MPGFVADGPVSLINATHPEFRESFRYFGVPSQHPCRLERMVVSQAKLGDWSHSLSCATRAGYDGIITPVQLDIGPTVRTAFTIVNVGSGHHLQRSSTSEETILLAP